MANPSGIDYLADLDDQLRMLDSRETSLETKYKAEKVEIATTRDGLAQARKHFLDYLTRTRSDPTAPQASLLPGVQESTIPLPTRMGELRRSMLDILVRNPHGLRVKEINRLTGILEKVVYTYAHRDTALGILKKDGDRLVLTEAGRDYMERAAVKFGPPPQKLETPPAEAGGALQ